MGNSPDKIRMPSRWEIACCYSTITVVPPHTTCDDPEGFEGKDEVDNESSARVYPENDGLSRDVKINDQTNPTYEIDNESSTQVYPRN